MNWRRFFLALAVTTVITLVADVLLNAVIFREIYRRSAALLLPVEQLNERVLVGWLALIVIVAMFGAILVLGGWRGIGGGLRFASLLAIASAAGIAGLASILPWPWELLAAVGVQQVVNDYVLGLTFGALYRPRVAGS